MLSWFFDLAPEMEFEVGTLPFSDYTSVIGASCSYLAIIYCLKDLMKNKKSYDLRMVVAVHNFFLCALSLLMVSGIMFELYRHYISLPQGTEIGERFFCDHHRNLRKGRHVFWYYIFMLSKIYEFLDTVILVLKKKPLIFLHVYHHFITLLLSFAMIEQMIAAQWVSIVANCSVHVLMYYYYGLSSLGIQVWWKKYITQIQIAQFVIDLVSNSFGFYYFFSNYGTPSACSGHLYAWLFGQAVLTSFLILFVQFFTSTYRKPAQKTE